MPHLKQNKQAGEFHAGWSSQITCQKVVYTLTVLRAGQLFLSLQTSGKPASS